MADLWTSTQVKLRNLVKCKMEEIILRHGLETVNILCSEFRFTLCPSLCRAVSFEESVDETSYFITHVYIRQPTEHAKSDAIAMIAQKGTERRHISSPIKWNRQINSNIGQWIQTAEAKIKDSQTAIYLTEVENNHPSEVRWNFVKKLARTCTLNFDNKCELRLFVGKQVIDLGWNICFISRKNSSTFPWADCSFCDKPSPPSFPATVPRIHIGRL